jgi:hypothetical protein
MRAVTKMQLSNVFAFSDGQWGSDQTLAFMRRSFIEVQQRSFIEEHILTSILIWCVRLSVANGTFRLLANAA